MCMFLSFFSINVQWLNYLSICFCYLIHKLLQNSYACLIKGKCLQGLEWYSSPWISMKLYVRICVWFYVIYRIIKGYLNVTQVRNFVAHAFFLFFNYKNTFMLSLTMQLDISVRLTSQVTTIIYHHMKKVLLKKEKKKKIQKYGGTRPKLTC